ncbi:hypothetical protein EON66_08490, partial [archaeon]
MIVVLHNDKEMRVESSLRESQHKIQLMKSASESRRTFLRYISHELRVPLAAISLGFEDLVSSMPQPIDSETNRSIAYVRRAEASMRHTLDSVLIVDRLESGALDVALAPLTLPHFVSRLRDETEIVKQTLAALTFASDASVGSNAAMVAARSISGSKLSRSGSSDSSQLSTSRAAQQLLESIPVRFVIDTSLCSRVLLADEENLLRVVTA